jgi:SET domain-containing protein
MRGAWQDRVYVKPSPIHGLGVFARRNFATGETVLVREERPVTPENPLDPEKDELEHHCDWLEGGRQVYLGFPERYVNHCCEPNAFMRVQDGVGHIVALRPIRVGEEVTNHYGVDLSRGDSWQCGCDSPRCLGVVTGDFFELPLDVQVELCPLLNEWFIKERWDDYDALMKRAGLDGSD